MRYGVARPTDGEAALNVQVVTDSLASIPRAELTRLGMDVVTLYVNDGENNLADLEIDHEAFFRRLADSSTLPTSSQPSVQSLVDAFTSAVERGSDVLGVFVSSKMSGTVETARMAAAMVLEKFPAGRIDIVDSCSNSMQEGFAALAAAAAAQAGSQLERCRSAAQETMARTRYLFTPESLDYLRRGGRIGGASALLGTLLQIRPILTVERGETQSFAKVRTQARALAEIARTFADDIASHGLRRVVVHYIGDPAPAERFAAEHIVPLAGGPVEIVPVSPVIGLHVGPAVGLVWETERPLHA